MPQHNALLKNTPEHGVVPCLWNPPHLNLLLSAVTPSTAHCAPTSRPIAVNKLSLHSLPCRATHTAQTTMAFDYPLLSP